MKVEIGVTLSSLHCAAPWRHIWEERERRLLDRVTLDTQQSILSLNVVIAVQIYYFILSLDSEGYRVTRDFSFLPYFYSFRRKITYFMKLKR